MSLYSLARPALFLLDPERAHHLTLNALARMESLGLGNLLVRDAPQDPRSVMGLTFPNPVGLAAGLDKDGRYIDALARLGFGFIEVGTVTPRAQSGNPKPRMFRLPAARAIINRMGFNNGGLEAFLENVKRSHFRERGGVLGLNIGKNADTPIDRAVDDYVLGLEKVYPHASYVAINISSPNTKNLRQLQGADQLDELLGALDRRRQQLGETHCRAVPLALKIAPDLEEEQIEVIAQAIFKHHIDGVIATNTTLSRTAVNGMQHGNEAGGLSGAPVLDASNRVIARLRSELGPDFPIIGVGGILSGEDAQAKMVAGASLVQLYSGLIYRGPELVGECVRALRSR
jgi:dihydroorotate dehydrogenase